jgi:hypothetical protein
MKIPSIFIHIPCSPEAVSDPCAFMLSGKSLMTVEDVAIGLETLLERAPL